jgi:hypothetical protein
MPHQQHSPLCITCVTFRHVRAVFKRLSIRLRLRTSRAGSRRAILHTLSCNNPTTSSTRRNHLPSKPSLAICIANCRRCRDSAVDTISGPGISVWCGLWPIGAVWHAGFCHASAFHPPDAIRGLTVSDWPRFSWGAVFADVAGVAWCTASATFAACQDVGASFGPWSRTGHLQY